MPLAGTRSPRIATRPPWASEASGDEAVDLAAAVGMDLFPWQADAVRAIMAERPDGRWAAREAGLLVSRQNGKNVILEAIALHGLFLARDPLTLWTAHQFKTTQEAFVRVRSWIEGNRDLRSQVKAITTATGNEGITLNQKPGEKAPPRLRFVARSKSSGRGFSPQRIMFDEAQELSVLAIEAMLPSLSAQHNPQVIFTGTVPNEQNDADYWTGVRDRGRAGHDHNLCWLEWSPRGSDDPESARTLDLDDQENIADANPSAGLLPGLNDETISAERSAFRRHPEAFARERLTIWPSGSPVSALIKRARWDALAADPPTGAIVSYGIKFSVDGQRVALAGALRVRDQPVFVEVIEERSMSDGVAWLTAWLLARWEQAATIVIDGRYGATALYAALRDLRVPERVITKPTADQVVAACSGMINAVHDKTITHGGQPGLSAAVAMAGKRDIGTMGGWGFQSIDPDGDVTVVEAVALAHYGALTSRRKPGRRAKVRV